MDTDVVTGTSELRQFSAEDLGRVAILADVAAMLNASYDVDVVLQKVMQIVVSTVDAERGFIMINRGTHDDLEVAAAAGVHLQDVVDRTFQYSTTVVDEVMSHGKPVLSHNALEDQRYSKKRSIVSMRLRCIMCLPMRTRNRTLGLIYLDSGKLSSRFTQTDLDLLAIIADMAAAAIERAFYFGAMMQGEKLAAIGGFVAGIVQEIDRPLTGIESAAALARHAGDGLSKSLDDIVGETVRCRRLIKDLLSLGRKQERVRTALDAASEIERAVQLARKEFSRDRVVLRVESSPQVPGLLGDPDQIVQVLLNLLSNARMASRGRDGAEVLVRLTRQSGARSSVRIQVADNGCGIPIENLKRVFEPFFTTHPGERTGLGLSIVDRIVHDHGGTVAVHNTPGGGAVFTVDLPAREDFI